ncbi:uncharacterized protein [Eleutherodactylus coqui]|uniref:Uncharacterized protein n=1 Tax=Eleutherodactylus coqui TaxID=57060 RepID=A0A8J6ENR6_ELECQ|nr:hypothetical protein GDO78_017445 [Eleutherodactylus coqui]
MRVLLILGCIALGILLVAASDQDQVESGIEAKSGAIQRDFVNVREFRSTGENKKKNKSPRKQLPGGFSAVARPGKTLEKRSTDQSQLQRKRKMCVGCYSPLSALESNKEFATTVLRHQRDTEEHGKLRKQHKLLKGKSKSKRRRNKNHRDKLYHIQEEDSEIQQNNKRCKHHKGKKDKLRSGMFSTLGMAPPDSKGAHKDISNMQAMIT